VGRSSSLSSHVRRDVSGSLGVELDAAYLSAAILSVLMLHASSKRDLPNLDSSPVAPLASPIGPVVILYFNVKLSGET
jgi:hypothetical protein